MEITLSSEMFESMIEKSGLNYSDFAKTIGLTPSNFRTIRRELRGGNAPNPRIIAAIRYHFGGGDALLVNMARDALAALQELEAAYGRDARPPHAPDPRAPWGRARAIIAKAVHRGLIPPL